MCPHDPENDAPTPIDGDEHISGPMEVSDAFGKAFDRYDALIDKADQAFAKIKDASGGRISCEKGCSDCCHALFDLSLVEAITLNHRFNQVFEGMERSNILAAADKADREVYKLKKTAFKMSEEGRPVEEILETIAKARVRCPLLSDQDACLLYESRPLTCRLYGAPQAIGGQAKTCPKTGFTAGEKIPVINVEKLQDEMMRISADLVRDLPTKNRNMGDMLVPLSMALLTEYDEKFLGLDEADVPPPLDAAAMEKAFREFGEQFAAGKDPVADAPMGIDPAPRTEADAKKCGCDPVTFSIGGGKSGGRA